MRNKNKHAISYCKICNFTPMSYYSKIGRIPMSKIQKERIKNKYFHNNINFYEIRRKGYPILTKFRPFNYIRSLRDVVNIVMNENRDDNDIKITKVSDAKKFQYKSNRPKKRKGRRRKRRKWKYSIFD